MKLANFFRCLCDPGFYYHNGKCLTSEECGCIVVVDPPEELIAHYAVCDTFHHKDVERG